MLVYKYISTVRASFTIILIFTLHLHDKQEITKTINICITYWKGWFIYYVDNESVLNLRLEYIFNTRIHYTTLYVLQFIEIYEFYAKHLFYSRHDVSRRGKCVYYESGSFDIGIVCIKHGIRMVLNLQIDIHIQHTYKHIIKYTIKLPQK